LCEPVSGGFAAFSSTLPPETASPALSRGASGEPSFVGTAVCLGTAAGWVFIAEAVVVGAVGVAVAVTVAAVVVTAVAAAAVGCFTTVAIGGPARGALVELCPAAGAVGGAVLSIDVAEGSCATQGAEGCAAAGADARITPCG